MALNTDRNDSGLTCVASFAGRLFYSGADSRVINGDDKSPNLGTFVFYTQVIDSKDNYDKCYQDADPTSENISDLLPTDGGFVVLSAADRIFKLVAVRSALIVFADNGVWAISGGQGGFSATDFAVTKITDVACDAPQTIVTADDVIFFWARGGIYVLNTNEITQLPSAQNITETTIQKFYTSIPAKGRRNAVGTYDPVARQLKWLYNDSDSYDGVTFRYIYNKELVFTLPLQAFNVNVLSNNVEGTTTGSVSAYFTGADDIDDIAQETVTVEGDTVTVSGEDVTVTAKVGERTLETVTKYLILYPGDTNYELSFGFYGDATFKDWGVDDAVGKIYTGYDSFGDTQRVKKLDNVTMHMKRTETGYVLDSNGNEEYNNPSSLNVRFAWAWAEDGNGPRVSDVQQGYQLPRQYIPEDVNDPFDYPTTVVSTRLNPRGRGEVLSMRLETEEGKDAFIYGWGITGSGNARL